MREREEYLRYQKEMFVQTYLRVLRLEKELPHSPGCIVRKGPSQQYTYWQIRQGGRQLQKYVKADHLAEVLRQIAALKEKKARLQELRHFLAEMKRALRAYKLHWQEVLNEFHEKRARQRTGASGRAAAKEVAASKKYASNYKHVTDGGDLVASKSEEIIANTMYAYGVSYQYEKELVINGTALKPDFTVQRPDGSAVLWEHAGLLDQEDYERQFVRKLELYRQAGYTQMKNLIVTYDENGAFDAATARDMIELYRLT